MTDKEKYTALMQRYWEAGTTPEEERALARYAARTDDPGFEELRGVLGYLSVGRTRKAARARTVRFFSLAAAAGCIVAVLVLGLSRPWEKSESYIRYSYGRPTTDKELIMESVERSLADFFTTETPPEDHPVETW